MNKVERFTNLFLNSIAGMLIFAVSFSAFYLPYEIRIIPTIEQYLEPVRYVCGAIVVVFFLLLYISRFRVFRDNWFLFACIGFVGILVFTTVMNNGYLEAVLGTYGISGIYLILTIAVFFRVNPKKYILMAYFLLLIVCIANTYTVFHYWGVGMWEVYGQYKNTYYSLIGNFNGGIEYVIPMAICGSAYAHRFGKWLDLINYPAMIMSLVMAIKCDSETQIIVFAAVIAVMAVGNIAMLSKVLSKVLRIIFQPVILWGINFAAFIAIVIINKTNWVAKLGLDPDFHNRRHIWNMSMDWIKQSPIWGYGQETVAVEATKITGYAHSHSSYLEIAYKTGFVGSVLMLLMLVLTIAAIYRNRNHRLSFMISAIMFLMGTAMIAETYPIVTIILCFGLVYYISKTTVELPEMSKRIRKVKPVAAAAEEAPSGNGDTDGLSNTVKLEETVVISADDMHRKACRQSDEALHDRHREKKVYHVEPGGSADDTVLLKKDSMAGDLSIRPEELEVEETIDDISKDIQAEAEKIISEDRK